MDIESWINTSFIMVTIYLHVYTHLTSIKSFSSALLRTRYSATVPSSACFSLSKTMSASQASDNSFKESTEAFKSSALRPLGVLSTTRYLMTNKNLARLYNFVNAHVASGGQVPKGPGGCNHNHTPGA